METSQIIIPPFFLEVDGCKVDVVEVRKSELFTGDVWYHVVVSIEYKGIKSKYYTLDVKDTKDLIDKLKIEITKLKFIEYAYGIEYLKRLIS
jgi:hypothetical protein